MIATVYGREICGHCRVTEKKLREGGVIVEKAIIDDHPDKLAFIQASGRLELPYVEVKHDDGSVENWSGLQPDAIYRIRRLAQAAA